MRLVFWCCLCLPIIHATDGFTQHAGLESQIGALINESAAKNSVWAFTVRDTSGNILASVNGGTLVKPASNLKLLTSAAILHTLGPDYTFTTNIYGSGHQTDSVWIGDLYIRGSGDPTISGRMYQDQKWYVFDRFTDSLTVRGIQVVRGDAIGNNALFMDEPYPPGWEWDDLTYYYAPEISALSFNENCVDLIVQANGSIGTTPEIEWFPLNTDYVNFINRQIITPVSMAYNESYRRIAGTNTILLASTLPIGYREEESLSVADPALFFVDSFRKYSVTQGIHWQGRAYSDQSDIDWNTLTLLATHESVRLSEMITTINSESSNFYTEMLMRAAAAIHYDTKGSNDLGITLIRDFALKNGFSSNNLQLKDGSGLAAYTLLTTDELTGFLVRMRSHPYFEAYYNSLSVAGINGNFKNRFGQSPLIGVLSGKSGYISGVRAISGYIETSSENRVVFSLITNNYTMRTSEIDRIQQRILEAVYAQL